MGGRVGFFYEKINQARFAKPGQGSPWDPKPRKCLWQADIHAFSQKDMGVYMSLSKRIGVLIGPHPKR